MKIISPSFKENEKIPRDFTCDGDNKNPKLEISGIPAQTKSLALIVDDPDAPKGTWIHWTLWNISPDIAAIEENSVPEGAIEGTTSMGRPGYEGPCPPSGSHHYMFKLYALDKVLDISSISEKADIEKAMTGHILDNAMLTGRYR